MQLRSESGLQNHVKALCVHLSRVKAAVDGIDELFRLGAVSTDHLHSFEVAGQYHHIRADGTCLARRGLLQVNADAFAYDEVQSVYAADGEGVLSGV